MSRRAQAPHPTPPASCRKPTKSQLLRCRRLAARAPDRVLRSSQPWPWWAYGRGQVPLGAFAMRPRGPLRFTPSIGLDRSDRPEHLDDGAAYRRIGRRRAASRRATHALAANAPDRADRTRRALNTFYGQPWLVVGLWRSRSGPLGAFRHAPLGGRFASGLLAPDPRQPVRTRRQRLPPGYDTGAFPRLHVVGDAICGTLSSRFMPGQANRCLTGLELGALRGCRATFAASRFMLLS